MIETVKYFMTTYKNTHNVVCCVSRDAKQYTQKTI